MPKIFCCYRRNDSEHQTGRIFDHLTTHYGKDGLFKDVDSMPLGLDFRTVLAEKVGHCDVLLAIIGDTWLSASDETGRRLDNADDYVRIEIESALRRNIPVVPVFVGQTPILRLEELPKVLRELHFRQGIHIRPDPDFHNDMVRLVSGINIAISSRTAETGTRTGNPDRRAPVAPPTPATAPGQAASVMGRHTRSFLDQVMKASPGFAAGTSPLASANPEPPLSQVTTVRIGVLNSGNATYVNEIENAFRSQLKSELTGHQIRVVIAKDCVEWADEAQWPTTVSRLLERGGEEGFDFFLGIGTQAAIALRDTLGADFGKKPALLLGVTYPRVAGLVDSEHFRCESRQVACIRYGCGLDAVASLLHHRIFPGRKLCFVFQAGIPQDELAYMELSTTRLVREGLLRFLRLEQRLEVQDLADAETVYFSWYTFTRLFHEREFSILKDRLAVSVMQDNVRDAAALAGVGTDHDWIGKRGAEMVSEYLSAPDSSKPAWGAREVIVSPLVYWLNRRLAKRRGMEFPPDVLAGAAEVYD